MSTLSVMPDIVAAATGDFQNIGSALRDANAAAAPRTTAIAAPAADEVSAAITALFDTRAHEFGTLTAKAAAFHQEFVYLLNGAAGQYLHAEIANAAALLRPLTMAARATVGAYAAFQDQLTSLLNTVSANLQLGILLALSAGLVVLASPLFVVVFLYYAYLVLHMLYLS
jgi:PE family